MKTYLTYALGLLLVLTLTNTAYAVPVYDTPVLGSDLTSSRQETLGQILTGGSWLTDQLNFTVAWDINPIVGGYHYKYTFSGFSSPDMSHIILDLSTACTSSAAGCVQNLTSNGGNDGVPGEGGIGDTEYGTFGPGADNPGFPAGATIQGIKFDALGDNPPVTIIEFDSNRAPVWGDIYGKGGSNSFFYNNGLELANHNSESILDFVARPDSQVDPVPEPSTWLLMSLGLVGLAVWRMKKQTVNGETR